MQSESYKTYSAKPTMYSWYVIDAEGVVQEPCGDGCDSLWKHKPCTPHIDTGDHVVIINADKVALTAEAYTEALLLAYRIPRRD